MDLRVDAAREVEEKEDAETLTVSHCSCFRRLLRRCLKLLLRLLGSHFSRLLFEGFNLVVDNGNLHLQLQKLLLQHLLVAVVSQDLHRAPFHLGDALHEVLLLLSLGGQSSIFLELFGILLVEEVVSLLTDEAEQAEHESTWDGIARPSKEQTKTKTCEGARQGGGADFVRASGVQVIADMQRQTASSLPPVEDAIWIEDGGASGPEGAS